jgi:hypothetical protein
MAQRMSLQVVVESALLVYNAHCCVVADGLHNDAALPPGLDPIRKGHTTQLLRRCRHITGKSSRFARRLNGPGPCITSPADSEGSESQTIGPLLTDVQVSHFTLR